MIICACDFDRLSGIQSAIETCDALNFGQVLQRLALINYGKLSSLSFDAATKEYEFEVFRTP